MCIKFLSKEYNLIFKTICEYLGGIMETNGAIYYLSEIMKVVEELGDRHSQKFDSKPLIAFRGESRDFAETKLMPSIFRSEERRVGKECRY